MAGLDGIENKIHPGEAATKDLYHLPPEEDALVPTVCHSLDQALEYLDKDRAFLTKGGVFTDSMIDAYIELKMGEGHTLPSSRHTPSNTTCITHRDQQSSAQRRVRRTVTAVPLFLWPI
jgi:glutamine synthetase